jgi:L-cysteine desulfidase
MDLDSATIAAIAALVPSTVVGLLAFFLRRSLEGLEGSVRSVAADVKGLVDTQGKQSTALAVMGSQLDGIDNEVGKLREGVHELRGLAAKHGVRLDGLDDRVQQLEQRKARR